MSDPYLERAVVEFSLLRPRLATQTLTTVVGQTVYDLPTDAYDVVSCGDLSRVAEAEALSGAVEGWAVVAGKLVLSPAPIEVQTLALTASLRHYYDPDAVPPVSTLAFGDDAYIQDLRQAVFLEVQADEIELGPSRYTIGQSEYEYAVGGLRKRAADIRRRVIQTLSEPIALWR